MRGPSNRNRAAPGARWWTVFVALLACGVFAPATAEAAQLQCSGSASTFPPGTPAVTFLASHGFVDGRSSWLTNHFIHLPGEHIRSGRCPTANGDNQGSSCSPARSCGSDQVCASGYRPWASCPADAGPIEQDDRSANSSWEDPEEGPSTANDSEDTGEQGPCICWDDSDPDQYICDSHGDCPTDSFCVEGKCRCRNFDWSDCDELRFGLTVFDEFQCQSNTSEHTNHTVAEIEEAQSSWTSTDVTQEAEKLPSRDAACTDLAYRPTDRALLEHQREEKFPTSNSRVTDRMWDRAHANILMVTDLPQTSDTNPDGRVRASLDQVCSLLEGNDGDGAGSVPPMVTYVLNDSDDGGTCAPDDNPVDVWAGMMAAAGGTGSCCYDANADGDCTDSGDLSSSSIGDPGGFCSHVRGAKESTLRSRIDPSKSSEGQYICDHRTAPGELGNAPFCTAAGADCQLAGGDNAHGTKCGDTSLAGDADLMEAAMCLHALPDGESFSTTNYELCDSTDDGDNCRALGRSEVEFLDPNERIFRIPEAARTDANGDPTSCANLQVDPCPNEGRLCTTPNGCSGGVIKCFGDEEKCVPPVNVEDEVACDGVDNDCDGFTDEGIATVGEGGRVEELQDDGWKSMSYETSFDNTPIVLSTTQTDVDDENPSPTHVRSTTKSGFEAQHCELELGGSPTFCDLHGSESLGWFAVDPNVLGPYAGVQAGTYESKQGVEVRKQIQFPEVFERPPLVFSAVQTTDGSNVPRNIHPIETTPTSATIAFCEQNTRNGCGWHTDETVGWLAVNPDANDLNAGIELGTVQTSGSGWESVTFSNSFNEIPAVLAEVQTENDPEEEVFAEVRNVTRTGAEIRFCEYDGNDQCDDHGQETVAWMAVDPKVTAGNAVKKACDTGREGRCSVGIQTCVDGSLTACESVNRPIPEACNGLDDDCDGTVDNIEESWSKSWSVAPEDLSSRGRGRVCSGTSACLCTEPSDRDVTYRSSKAAGTLEEEFEGMIAATVAENTDDDDGDGKVDEDDNSATRCRCSE